MTAVDPAFVLGKLYNVRQAQEGLAQLPSERIKPRRRLHAEARSYTVSLLIDAINDGLLEQLHAEAEQRLFLAVAVDQDNAWAAYLAGMGAAPEDTAPLAVPVDDDTPAGGAR